MRIFGFAVPLFVLIIGAYIIGAKFPGLFNKAKGAVSGG
jgi:hypothetical protein